MGDEVNDGKQYRITRRRSCFCFLISIMRESGWLNVVFSKKIKYQAKPLNDAFISSIETFKRYQCFLFFSSSWFGFVNSKTKMKLWCLKRTVKCKQQQMRNELEKKVFFEFLIELAFSKDQLPQVVTNY